MDATFWNDRYRTHKTLYGVDPNLFFKEQLDKLPPGKLLLPAEGEGRNAIYAASHNWQVTAFDFSEQAQQKALAQARELNLAIDYTIQDIRQIILPIQHYDVVALIYVHLEPAVRLNFFAQCVRSLKPGGKILLEGFATDQLKFQSGGPKEKSMLYTITLLQELFGSLQVELIKQEDILLQEGEFHKGPASVVRLVASKPA